MYKDSGILGSPIINIRQAIEEVWAMARARALIIPAILILNSVIIIIPPFKDCICNR